MGQKGFRNLRPVERGSMISDISYRGGLVSFAYVILYHSAQPLFLSVFIGSL